MKISKRAILTQSAAAAAIAVSAPALAQDSEFVAAGGEENAIVVTGFRGSLERSIDIKRDSAAVVDAISAEDVGKFPDQNAAEALQRIIDVRAKF